MQDTSQITDPQMREWIDILKKLDIAKIEAAPTLEASAPGANAIRGNWVKSARIILRRAPSDNDAWRTATLKEEPPFTILAAGEPGKFEGNPVTQSHNHPTLYRFAGYIINGLPSFPYTVSRELKTPPQLVTELRGVAVLNDDKTMTSLVYANDGNDPELPRDFREIINWKKATLG